MPHKFLTWVELAGHVAPFSLDILAIGEHSIVKNITFGTGLSQLAHTGLQSTNQRHKLEDFKSHEHSKMPTMFPPAGWVISNYQLVISNQIKSLIGNP